MKSIGTIVVVFALAMAPFAFSQQTKKEKREEAATRSLVGQVTDANDQPVDLAIVQLKDMKTLQIRSFVTQKGGQYRFSALNRDVDYQVKAEFQGASSAPKTLSVFDGRKDPVLNLKLDKK